MRLVVGKSQIPIHWKLTPKHLTYIFVRKIGGNAEKGLVNVKNGAIWLVVRKSQIPIHWKLTPKHLTDILLAFWHESGCKFRNKINSHPLKTDPHTSFRYFTLIFKAGESAWTRTRTRSNKDWFQFSQIFVVRKIGGNKQQNVFANISPHSLKIDSQTALEMYSVWNYRLCCRHCRSVLWW